MWAGEADWWSAPVDGGHNELHRAMQQVYSTEGSAEFEKIVNLISKDADLAQARDVLGKTPLHIGMTNACVPLEAIQAVLDVYPEAAEIQDVYGLLPLHCGVKYGLPSDIIQLLCEQYPEAAEIQEKEGGSAPLHLGMIRSSTSKDVIDTLLGTCPMAAQMKNSKGYLPLHCGLSTTWCKIDNIRSVLDAYPKASEMCDNQGETALHIYMESGGTDFKVFDLILQSNPNATKVCDKLGRTPLHVALASVKPFDEAIHALLKEYPGASKIKDVNGRVPLHNALERGPSLAFETMLAVLNANRNAVQIVDKSGNLPLHYGMHTTETFEHIQALLKVYPEAAGMRDRQGRLVLHWAIHSGAPLECIRACFEAYPHAAKLTSQNGRTALSILVEKHWSLQQQQQNAETKKRKQLHNGQSDNKETSKHEREESLKRLSSLRQILKILYDGYPEAAEIENNNSSTPIDAILSWCSRAQSMDDVIQRDAIYWLQLLIQKSHDGRAFRKLFRTDNPVALQVFLAVFGKSLELDEDMLNDAIGVTSIDLNEEKIPRWTMLETLADLDNHEASRILLQIVKGQKGKLGIAEEVFTISAAGGEEICFCSTKPVTEETMLEVADRAKLSECCLNLKEWGEQYGRFLQKYRIEKDKDPKHVSATCVVVFGTELRTSQNGRRLEAQVALKFMCDKDAFLREIGLRKEINRFDKSRDKELHMPAVVPVLAAFTSQSRDGLKIPVQLDPSFITPGTDLQNELQSYGLKWKNVDFSSLQHLLVMECGSGLDANDVISHQDIAGKNLMMVLHMSLSIARILRYLNEECKVSHGDPKDRNFVSEGVGGQYMAIDMDNSAVIGDEAGQKRTSSGYLPPEQAKVELFLRKKAAAECTTDACINAEVEKAKEDLRKIEALLDSLNCPFQSVLSAREEAQKKLKDLQNPEAPAKPDPVMASSQYDMWGFGCTLYKLCTGRQLFDMDEREQVKDKELQRIINWNENDFYEKFEVIPEGEAWQRIRLVLEQVLQPDPSKRPPRWKPVIKMLKEAPESEVIRKLNEMQKTLKTVENELNNLPNLVVQLETVNCPYLFEFVTKDRFEDSIKQETIESQTKQNVQKRFEKALDRSREVLQRANEVAEMIDDTDSLKKKGISKLFDKVTGKKVKVRYLQLLCGRTFKPIVSYEVRIDKYPEKVEEMARIGAKMCAVGIKLSILWNYAATGARMFGYPVPEVPTEIAEKAKEFLVKINETSPAEDLIKKDDGFNLQELADFETFLTDLEGDKRIRQIHENTGNLEGSWSDAFCKAVVELNGKKQITYISKRESEKLGYKEKDLTHRGDRR